MIKLFKKPYSSRLTIEVDSRNVTVWANEVKTPRKIVVFCPWNQIAEHQINSSKCSDQEKINDQMKLKTGRRWD